MRADDAAADNEYGSFLACAGLHERDLRRYRLEQRPLGNIDLRDWSGIFLGGGPFTVSDPEGSKSPVQRRVEADLRGLLETVISADFPFLGGLLWHRDTRQPPGGRGRPAVRGTDRRGPRHAHPRRPGQDPLLRGLPPVFDAFVGHKEAISRLPHHAVLLASSPACPVQAFRIGSAVYATQFHPELDAAGLCTRIEVYKHAGYFEPAQAGELKARAHRSNVSHPPGIVRRFARRHAGQNPRRAAPGCRPSLSTSARIPPPAHGLQNRTEAGRGDEPGQSSRSGRR